jgi:hypothetical protein
LVGKNRQQVTSGLAKWRAEVIVRVALIGFTVGVSSSCADCYPPLRQAAVPLDDSWQTLLWQTFLFREENVYWPNRTISKQKQFKLKK